MKTTFKKQREVLTSLCNSVNRGYSYTRITFLTDGKYGDSYRYIITDLDLQLALFSGSFADVHNFLYGMSVVARDLPDCVKSLPF